MAPVEFKKRPSRPVKFKGKGPQLSLAFDVGLKWGRSHDFMVETGCWCMVELVI